MRHWFWRVIGLSWLSKSLQHFLDVADRKFHIGRRLWASQRVAAKNERAIPTAVMPVKGIHGPDVPDVPRTDQTNNDWVLRHLKSVR